MADYELRSKALNLKLDKLVKKNRRRQYIAQLNGGIGLDEALYEELFDMAEYGQLYAEAKRVVASDYRRNTRLKNTLKRYMEQGPCLFLTFTFRQSSLDKTSVPYRRHQVTDFLKKYSNCYVANIDYGGKNGREHYHAFIQCDKVSQSDWKHGNLDWERVRTSSDPLCMSRYMSKLVNHAVKDTCKRNSLIYSRSERVAARDVHMLSRLDALGIELGKAWKSPDGTW